MAFKFWVILVFVLLVVVDMSSSSKLVSFDGSELASFNFHGDGSGGLIKTCNGLVGECIEEDEEMSIDSELVRRSLATRKFISYNALRKNAVPCNTRGASYYRCGRASKVNPYRRSCSRITFCARNLS